MSTPARSSDRPPRRRRSTGSQLRTNEPLAELFSVVSVEQAGAVVRITLDGEGDLREALQGLQAADLLVVVVG